MTAKKDQTEDVDPKDDAIEKTPGEGESADSSDFSDLGSAPDVTPPADTPPVDLVNQQLKVRVLVSSPFGRKGAIVTHPASQLDRALRLGWVETV